MKDAVVLAEGERRRMQVASLLSDGSHFGASNKRRMKTELKGAERGAALQEASGRRRSSQIYRVNNVLGPPAAGERRQGELCSLQQQQLQKPEGG